MQRSLSVVATAILLAACGDVEKSNTSSGDASPGVPFAEAVAPQTTTAASGSGRNSPAPATHGLAGRTGELVNPDNSTMVFLYYDMAGVVPPIDKWVENDMRVRSAKAPDKASQRMVVKDELAAAAQAVRNIGFIRLSLNNANLSDYDPTYGEFTVRALAPSSVVTFDALGQQVVLKFGNGKTAQIWRVTPAEAQAIRDKIGPYGSVSLDAQLAISSVQPGPGGGTITADVIEYELRETHTGITVARVQLKKPQ